LSGGLINTNLKVSFEANYDPVVLRVYRDGAEPCRKEVALHSLLRAHVRVPEILHSKTDDSGVSFSVLQYINGITFQQLTSSGNVLAISDAARSVGRTLGAIGQVRFPRPGKLEVEKSSNQLRVGEPFITGPDSIPRLLDRFLESTVCCERLGADLTSSVRDFVWAWSSAIPNLDERPTLVHNDFGNRNILVREDNGQWVVAAVLDWELAFSGSQLLDVGHFLRYEKACTPQQEPFFSQGFIESGGQLPEDWKAIVRVIDLTGLVECLTHENLPREVELELLELIKATVEHRDPEI